MGWRKLGYTRRLFQEILPKVSDELAAWKMRAEAIPDPILQRQALASLEHKRFHCEGGATFALFVSGSQVSSLVSLIVAFQTISDYLDNLCDRSASLDPKDYRLLHKSMLDAVIPGPPLSRRQAENYYRAHTSQEDGGYLHLLVETCRKRVATLPGYDLVAPFVWQLTQLYTDLQVLKHGPKQWRVELLKRWYARHKTPGLAVDWHEFGAAAGSTLAIFALFALAAQGRPQPHRIMNVLQAYFPWVCSLHILLDYWIDQDEDRIGDDLNFTAYYNSSAGACGRLQYILRQALQKTSKLDDRKLHEAIIQGLPALYLSDPKAQVARIKPFIRSLLDAAGPAAWITYLVCRLRRRRSRCPEIQAPPLVPRI